MGFVPAVQVVLELFGVRFLQQWREVGRAVRDQLLEQPAARCVQVVGVDERLTERHRRAVRGGDRFIAARADGREHAIDQLRIVARMDAQRVAREVGRRMTVDRDFVVACVLFRSGAGEADVGEMSAGEMLFCLSCHAPPRL